jgi:AcrR family transcriptional regulator
MTATQGAADPRAAGSEPAAAAPQQARPLRRDAERNRQRILRAAAGVFTERGLDATLDDVARRAGVGVATVYRRFPDKESLAEALFAERVEELAGLADRALDDPDPWDGLTGFLTSAAEMLCADRGLRQLMLFATYGRDRVDRARARMQPIVTRLVERAQRHGAVRADLEPTDLPLIEFMLTAAAEYGGGARPGLWRRYLGLFLDGLRPSRAGVSALPEPALTPGEVEAAVRAKRAAR